MGSSEIKVGAFTLCGVAVLAGMITFMGAFSLGRDGYELHINYPQVSGLMPGNMVRYAGVQVGSVREIKVSPQGVEVLTDIDDNIKIPQGATFSIGADGILGEKFVNVVPPAQLGQAYIAAGSQIEGVAGGSMEDFFASSGDLMIKIENIADAFNNVFGDPEVQASMRSGLKDLSGVSKNMNDMTRVLAEVAQTNQQSINLMIQQISELTVRMNNIAMHMESIVKEVDNKGETGRNIAAVAQHMADTTSRIENMVKVLESVATDPVTAHALKDTVVNAKEASARANKILATFSDTKVHADISRSTKGNKWRGNLGISVNPTDSSYIYMGNYDVGGSSKFDFIAGKNYGNTGLSMGAMQGDFGVGVSQKLGPSFRLYSQVYDFNDAKIRLGGEFYLNDNFSLYGESMDLKGSSEDTYLGVRGHF